MFKVMARLRVHLLRALLVLGMALQPLLAAAVCCEQGPACCATVPGQVPCSTSCALPVLPTASAPVNASSRPTERHADQALHRLGERHRDIWRPPRA